METTCRTCMKTGKSLTSVFDLDLPNKIFKIAEVKVSRDDGLPSRICSECINNVNLCYSFYEIIKNSDSVLRRCCGVANSLVNSLDAVIKFDSPEVKIKDEISFIDHLEIIQESAGDESEYSYEFQPAVCKPQSKIKVKKKSTVKKRKKAAEDTVYCCAHCDFSSGMRRSFVIHLRGHDAKRVCNICGKCLRSDNLSKHIKSHLEDPVICPECGKRLKNTESLRGHMLIHGEKVHKCDTCGKAYSVLAEYKRHLSLHNPNRMKTIRCDYCPKLFYNKKSMSKHIRSHTGDRPYICEYCNKGFSSSYARKTHVRQHTNEKPFVCNFCSMGFRQKISLVTHVKSKHSKIKEETEPT